jgi:hypothetical protein
MRSWKLSISALMSVVLFTGIGFAALSHPTRLWAALLLNLAGAISTVAILPALFARGPRRAFWAGFAIAGWISLIMNSGSYVGADSETLPNAALDILYSLTGPAPAPVPVPGTLQFVLTGGTFSSAPVSATGTVITPPPSPPPPVPGLAVPTPATPVTLAPSPTPWSYWTEEDITPASMAYSNSVNSRPPTPAAFYGIGHALMSMIAALLGALIAKRISEHSAGASESHHTQQELTCTHRPEGATQLAPPEQPRA